MPAHSWLEYTTWQPEFRLYGFADGRQVYFQQLRVKPRYYHYLGNRYDFVATIKPEAPALDETPRPPAPKRQKRRRS